MNKKKIKTNFEQFVWERLNQNVLGFHHDNNVFISNFIYLKKVLYKELKIGQMKCWYNENKCFLSLFYSSATKPKIPVIHADVYSVFKY